MPCSLLFLMPLKSNCFRGGNPYLCLEFSFLPPESSQWIYLASFHPIDSGDHATIKMLCSRTHI